MPASCFALLLSLLLRLLRPYLDSASTSNHPHPSRFAADRTPCTPPQPNSTLPHAEPTALLARILSPLLRPCRQPHSAVIPASSAGTQRPDRSQRTPPPRQPRQPELASPQNPSQPQRSSSTRQKTGPSYLSPARTPSGGSGRREIAPPFTPVCHSEVRRGISPSARTPSPTQTLHWFTPPPCHSQVTRDPVLSLPNACPELAEGRNLAFIPCSPAAPRRPSLTPSLWPDLANPRHPRRKSSNPRHSDRRSLTSPRGDAEPVPSSPSGSGVPAGMWSGVCRAPPTDEPPHPNIPQDPPKECPPAPQEFFGKNS